MSRLHPESYLVLHDDGSLALRRYIFGSVDIFMKAPDIAAFWEIYSDDSFAAQSALIEALAAGANQKRVIALADLWAFDDAAAHRYADRYSIGLESVNGLWRATAKAKPEYKGFGESPLLAMADLCRQLGYHAVKHHRRSFAVLLTI